jgi:hypothetical protein
MVPIVVQIDVPHRRRLPLVNRLISARERSLSATSGRLRALVALFFSSSPSQRARNSCADASEEKPGRSWLYFAVELGASQRFRRQMAQPFDNSPTEEVAARTVWADRQPTKPIKEQKYVSLRNPLHPELYTMITWPTLWRKSSRHKVVILSDIGERIGNSGRQTGVTLCSILRCLSALQPPDRQFSAAIAVDTFV